jgi:hypothetical protein
MSPPAPHASVPQAQQAAEKPGKVCGNVEERRFSAA